MKDLLASLRAYSERGTPIGSQSLRERVAFALAAVRLEPEPTRRRLPGPVVAATAAALALVLFGGVAFMLSRRADEAVTPTVTPSTTVISSTTEVPTTAYTTLVPPTTAAAVVGAVVPPAPAPLEPVPPDLLMNWEELSPASFAEGRLDAVVAGSRGLIAVGAAADGAENPNFTAGVDNLYADAAVWLSPDGRTWSRIGEGSDVFASPPPYELDQRMGDVTAWRGGFVAVGRSEFANSAPEAAVWRSEDGTDWERVPDDHVPDSDGPDVVVAAGSRLIAVEPGPLLWQSEDGVDWTRLDGTVMQSSDCVGSVNMVDVAVGGPGLIATGTVSCPSGERAAVWVSFDGAVWEQILLDTGWQGASYLSSARAIAVGPTAIAVVGFVSDQPVTDPPQYGTHGFGAIWISADGIEWRLAAVLEHGTLPETGYLSYRTSADAVLWDGDRLLVFGTARHTPGGGSGYALVWGSGDLGQTWHLLLMDAADQGPGRDNTIVFPPREPGFTVWYSPQPLMRDAVVFGSQVMVVGGTPNLGSGVVWIGEWATG